VAVLTEAPEKGVHGLEPSNQRPRVDRDSSAPSEAITDDLYSTSADPIHTAERNQLEIALSRLHEPAPYTNSYMMQRERTDGMTMVAMPAPSLMVARAHVQQHDSALYDDTALGGLALRSAGMLGAKPTEGVKDMSSSRGAMKDKIVPRPSLHEAEVLTAVPKAALSASHHLIGLGDPKLPGAYSAHYAGTAAGMTSDGRSNVNIRTTNAHTNTLVKPNSTSKKHDKVSGMQRVEGVETVVTGTGAGTTPTLCSTAGEVLVDQVPSQCIVSHIQYGSKGQSTIAPRKESTACAESMLMSSMLATAPAEPMEQAHAVRATAPRGYYDHAHACGGRAYISTDRTIDERGGGYAGGVQACGMLSVGDQEGEDIEDRYLADSDAAQRDTTRKAWHTWEDQMILESVQDMGQRWRHIAAMLPGRSDDAVRNRWNRLQEALKEGTFPPSDELTEKPKAGYKCSKCGQPKRNHVCAQRHLEALYLRGGKSHKKTHEGASSTSVDDKVRVGWTRHEDETIRACVRSVGPRWSLIAGELPGRTEHAVRNRWHRLQNLEADADIADGLDSTQLPPRSAPSLPTVSQSANHSGGSQMLVGMLHAADGAPGAAPLLPAATVPLHACSQPFIHRAYQQIHPSPEYGSATLISQQIHPAPDYGSASLTSTAQMGTGMSYTPPSSCVNFDCGDLYGAAAPCVPRGPFISATGSSSYQQI